MADRTNRSLFRRINRTERGEAGDVLVGLGVIVAIIVAIILVIVSNVAQGQVGQPDSGK